MPQKEIIEVIRHLSKTVQAFTVQALTVQIVTPVPDPFSSHLPMYLFQLYTLLSSCICFNCTMQSMEAVPAG